MRNILILLLLCLLGQGVSAQFDHTRTVSAVAFVGDKVYLTGVGPIYDEPGGCGTAQMSVFGEWYGDWKIERSFSPQKAMFYFTPTTPGNFSTEFFCQYGYSGGSQRGCNTQSIRIYAN